MTLKLGLEILGVIGAVVALWFVGVYWKAHRVRAVNRFNDSMARIFGPRKQLWIWIAGIATLIIWGWIYVIADDSQREATPLDAWIDGVKKEDYLPDKSLPELIQEAIPKSSDKPKDQPPEDGSPKAPIY